MIWYILWGQIGQLIAIILRKTCNSYLFNCDNVVLRLFIKKITFYISFDAVV